jgi:peptidoglycan/LPS O-acetylase OafA/YrhL
MGVSGLLGLLAGSVKGVAQSIFAGLIVAGLYYFLKGSDRARVLLGMLSIFWFLVALVILIAFPSSEFFPFGLVIAILTLLYAFCAYLLLFSRDLKQELARRAESSAREEIEEKRKLYQSMSEKLDE